MGGEGSAEAVSAEWAQGAHKVKWSLVWLWRNETWGWYMMRSEKSVGKGQDRRWCVCSRAHCAPPRALHQLHFCLQNCPQPEMPLRRNNPIPPPPRSGGWPAANDLYYINKYHVQNPSPLPSGSTSLGCYSCSRAPSWIRLILGSSWTCLSAQLPSIPTLSLQAALESSPSINHSHKNPPPVSTSREPELR